MKNITHKLFFVALLLMGTTIYAQESAEDMDLEELEEVVLVGGGVIDLARNPNINSWPNSWYIKVKISMKDTDTRTFTIDIILTYYRLSI